MPTHQTVVRGAICAVLLAAGACKEEGPTKLFEEQGTWSLDKFDIGEGIENLDLQEREDKFLINFDPESEIVSAAFCVDSMGNSEITESLCDTSEFACRCFTYTYEESQMIWTEFQPEGNPAPPEPPEDTGAKKPGEPFVINLEPYPESNGTYRYSGLPYGLFSSDGTSSRYVFQVRGNGLFEATGCLDVCGAAVDEPEAEM